MSKQPENIAVSGSHEPEKPIIYNVFEYVKPASDADYVLDGNELPMAL